MSEDRTPPSLEDLEARLRKARGESEAQAPGEGHAKKPPTGLGMAFRIGSELVAGLIVGVGIGLLLDTWLGTSPWFLVAFFFLGAIAGMWNVYRTARGLGLAAGFRPAPGKDGETDKKG